MRRAVLAVSIVLSLGAAERARAAPSVVGAAVSPATATSGQPVRLTVTLSEPATAGGTEVNVRTFGPSGFPAQRALHVVPAGSTTFATDVLLPTGITRTFEYTLQAQIRGDGGFANAKVKVTGRPDTGGYLVTSVTGPTGVLVGQPANPIVTINQPAPPGGLMLVPQQYGTYNISGNIYFGAGPLYVPGESRSARVAPLLGWYGFADRFLGLYQPQDDALGVRLGVGATNPGRAPDSMAVWETTEVPYWFSFTSLAGSAGRTLGGAVGLGDAPNPFGTTVYLSSNSPDVVVPATVYVPPGSAGIRVPVQLSSTPSRPDARITARWGTRVTTGDVVILNTGLPAATPTPTPTPPPIPELTPPQTTVSAGTPTGRDITVSFASTEAGSTFMCELQRESVTLGHPAPCTSPIAYSGLEAGGYKFEVRARDPAGNQDSTPARVRFAIDAPARPAPATPSFSMPSSVPVSDLVVAGVSDPAAQIEVREVTATGKRLWPSLGGAADAFGRFAATVDALSAGTHHLSVRAVNATGASAWSAPQPVTVMTG